MTHKQAFEAYNALFKLNQQPMPIKTAYQIHKLLGVLRPEFDFRVDAEKKLLDELKPESINGSTVSFRNPGDVDTWRARMAEIDALETDIEVAPVHVPLSDEMKLAPGDFDALEGFVIFDE